MYKITNIKIISNFQLDMYCCPCPNGEIHSLKECLRFGEKFKNEPESQIVITLENEELNSVAIAICNVSSIQWTKPKYKIVEYWPNYVERSDAPRYTYVDDLSIETLNKIDWLKNKDWTIDYKYMFIRYKDSPDIISTIHRINDNGRA